MAVIASIIPVLRVVAQSTHAPQRAAAATPVKPAQLSPELLSLDEWVIRRFRGAQLLPDSEARSATPANRAGAPLVDGARTVDHRDTLVALHFDSAMSRPVLAAAAPVHFVDPSGDVSPIAGRVTARRAFRAPRKPNARDTIANDWRIGWAYLVAVPPKTATAATSSFGGWSLIEAPTSNAKRVNH